MLTYQFSWHNCCSDPTRKETPSAVLGEIRFRPYKMQLLSLFRLQYFIDFQWLDEQAECLYISFQAKSKNI